MKMFSNSAFLWVVGAAALLVSGCDGSPDPAGFSLMQPDHEYEVDTWGYNSEVYEITPRSNPGYSCLMWMLDSGQSMSVACFPKSEQ